MITIDPEGRALTWSAYYLEYGYPTKEACGSIEEALWFLWHGYEDGRFSPLRVTGPDGTVVDDKTMNGFLNRADVDAWLAEHQPEPRLPLVDFDVQQQQPPRAYWVEQVADPTAPAAAELADGTELDLAATPGFTRTDDRQDEPQEPYVIDLGGFHYTAPAEPATATGARCACGCCGSERASEALHARADDLLRRGGQPCGGAPPHGSPAAAQASRRPPSTPWPDAAGPPVFIGFDGAMFPPGDGWQAAQIEFTDPDGKRAICVGYLRASDAGFEFTGYRLPAAPTAQKGHQQP